MSKYKVTGVVPAKEVPSWSRREEKWSDLVDAVMRLEPNQALEVEFDDPRVAERARVAVRDAANLKARSVVVRTRVVNHDEDEGATLYLTRVRAKNE